MFKGLWLLFLLASFAHAASPTALSFSCETLLGARPSQDKIVDVYETLIRDQVAPFRSVSQLESMLKASVEDKSRFFTLDEIASSEHEVIQNGLTRLQNYIETEINAGRVDRLKLYHELKLRLQRVVVDFTEIDNKQAKANTQTFWNSFASRDGVHEPAGYVTAAAIAPSTHLLAVAYQNLQGQGATEYGINLWNLSANSKAIPFAKTTFTADAIGFTGDQKFIVASAAGRSIYIWRLSDHFLTYSKIINPEPGDILGPGNPLVLAPSSEFFAYYEPGTLRAYVVRTSDQAVLHELSVSNVIDKKIQISNISISADSTEIILDTREGYVSVYSAQTGKLLRSLHTDPNGAEKHSHVNTRSLVVSPNGTRIVRRDINGVVQLRDPTQGTLISNYTVGDCLTTFDGKFVVTRTTGVRGITAYDVDSGAEKRSAELPGFVGKLAVAHSSNLVAVPNDLDGIRLIDLETMTVRGHATVPKGGIQTVYFSKDDKFLIGVAQYTWRVYVWPIDEL